MEIDISFDEGPELDSLPGDISPMRMNDKRTGTQDFMKYLINIGKGPQDRQIQAVKETRDMKTGEQEVPLD